MLRRRFLQITLGAASAPLPGWTQPGSTAPAFEATWHSLRTHKLPAWFDGAKFGIFIHWGLYSVPAWAPPSGELGSLEWRQWFQNNPYAEWYLNSLRIPGSPTRKHHRETYGENYDYYQFAGAFNEAVRRWNPDAWARLFARAGARYAVLTTKHHDGFTLWPSKVSHPRMPERQLGTQRDLVGELTSAVRSRSLHMGLYYSGGLDWTFTEEPILDLRTLEERIPQAEDYARYADAHWQELIDRYQPSILWNDIGYPTAGKLRELFAAYYNRIPDGVINDRFGVSFCDFTTPEYAKYDRITPKKWESCRGLGFSFGYNRAEGPEHVIRPEALVELLIDIVSKNGNLLLNIGPRPDGSISELQTDRLEQLGGWLAVNGEGIFDTRPWVVPAVEDPEGRKIYFTRKDDTAYAFIVPPPGGREFLIPNLLIGPETQISVLGSPAKAVARQRGRDVLVRVEGDIPRRFATGFKITPLPWQLARD